MTVKEILKEYGQTRKTPRKHRTLDIKKQLALKLGSIPLAEEDSVIIRTLTIFKTATSQCAKPWENCKIVIPIKFQYPQLCAEKFDAFLRHCKN